MKRKILIIADSFSPKHNIGSVRPSKIAKHLSSLGCDLTIITSKKNYFGIDKILQVDQDQYGDIYEVSNNLVGELARKLRNLIIKYSNKYTSNDMKNHTNKNLIKATSSKGKSVLSFILYFRKYIVLKLKYLEEKNWAKQCEKYYNDKFEEGYFDNIFTSFGSASNLMVGLKLSKSSTKNNWIVDFRDPMIQEPPKSKLYRDYYDLQKEVLTQANHITTVSQGIKNNLLEFSNLSNFSLSRNKIDVLYNGFDVDDIHKLRDFNYNTKFKIVYCGSLYSGRRDLSIMFKALKKMKNNSNNLYKEVEFHYAGGEDKLINKWANLFDIKDIVFTHGVLPREESLELQAASDYIVAITWNGLESYQKGVIPGKIYESMMFDSKLVCLIFNDDAKESELEQIVNRYRLGYAYEITEDNDFEFKFLRNLKLDILNNNNNSMDKKVSSFEYKDITKNLLDIMSSYDDLKGRK